MPTYLRFFLFLAVFSCLLIIDQGRSFAAERKQVLQKDDTMLMFVGEQIEILSIASRREESAAQAPAVAQVISREEFQEQGLQTLSQVLERTPGFYMAQKEWGSLPYLRGIPNSALFLYDTVPLTSDTSKDLHQLDRELSLAPVKRIEIIRGASSVLWGPDAFAGVVNVVPLSGKDIDGIETGLLYGESEEEKGFYLNMGKAECLWDGMLSISGREMDSDEHRANVVRFWQEGDYPVAPEERFGSKSPGSNRFVDITGRFSYQDWLSISGRVSDNEKSYTVSEASEKYSWVEHRELPFSYFKLEANKKISTDTALRFTGFYSHMSPEFEIINKSFKQDEDTTYGELILDQSFFSGQGLFTGGVSYREKDIDDAPIWDGYFPEYLSPENESFLPSLLFKDYHTNLWSVFGQYTHKVRDLDFFLGLRSDFHDSYSDQISFNTGIVWHPASSWHLKLLYANGYRTPFAKQLLEDKEPDLEEIQTVNAQLAWSPKSNLDLKLTGFFSRIEDHIMADPYAGLSKPNHQNIFGMELEGSYSPIQNLTLNANLTLLDNNGPDEEYLYKEYSFVRPDGTEVDVYSELEYPFDVGPKAMFNFSGTWRVRENITTNVHFKYFSSRDLVYPRGEKFDSASGEWRVDLSTTIYDVFTPNLDLIISARNLTDNDYETPGTYSMIEGDPLEAEVMLRYSF